MPASILFEVETGSEIAAFELAGDDLPKDYESGFKLRETVTRYAGTFTSVQVHGEEFEPIEFEGVLDDTWTADPGHALALRDTIIAIVALGELVRFEYESDQFWGTLEASFKEIRRDRIEYKIKFKPYWREDPQQVVYLAFAEPPLDLGENLDAGLGELKTHLEVPPLGVDLSFVGDVVLDVLSAKNLISNVLGYLDDVGAYAELTAELVGITTRSLFGAARSLDSVAKKLKGAGDSILSNTASAKIEGAQWIYQGSRLTRRTLSDLLAMLRKFLQTREPTRVQLYTVKENDTLQRLARDFLGDFSRWTEIADANDLPNSEIVRGQVLKIPTR